MNLLSPTARDHHDAEAELAAQSASVQEAAKKLRELLAGYELEGAAPPQPASLPYRAAEDRQNFKVWAGVIHALPAQDQQRMPSLLRLLAWAEWGWGEFLAAQRDFHNLAEALEEPSAKASAYYQAYLCALERPHLTDALYELRFALAYEPRRYAPFPLNKYEPDRLLAVDRFGLLARCRLRSGEGMVCVRTVDVGDLDRGGEGLLADLNLLKSVVHPTVIKVGAAAFHEDAPQRLVVMVDYLEGSSLEHYLTRHGAMTVRDAVHIGRQLAEGLAAAHAVGLTHRAVRPANVHLQRVKESGFKAVLGDFGVACRPELLRASSGQAAQLVRTLPGRTLANILDYAAPEQLGKADDVVGPPSDVYGWAKTLCLALFHTPHPAWNHWQTIPDDLAVLLSSCLSADPVQRPTFSAVLEQLQALTPVAPPPPTPSADQKDPKLAPTVAPPPGVGMTFEPKKVSGMPVRRRLTDIERLKIRIQRLTVIYGLILLGAIIVLGLGYVIFFYRPTVAAPVVAPVRGKVSIMGRPVAFARITFHPESPEGVTARGETDEQGNFTLTSNLPDDGAYPGWYRVVVRKDHRKLFTQPTLPSTDPRNPGAVRENPMHAYSEIDRRYTELGSTPLRLFIPREGTLNLDIQLNVLGMGAR
jgi:hypothetical protein